MSKWVNNDAIRGAELIMQIKQAALEGGLDNPISSITGCGVAVVTRYLDALLKDWIDLTSDCADAKRDLEIYKDGDQEWRDFGFDSGPTEYSAERQPELRTLAKRWNDEDETSMDAKDLEEIEERRQRRETQQ